MEYENEKAGLLPPIPSEVIFPLELSRHLKGQLVNALEENWHLKKYIESQENELSSLRQFKVSQKEQIFYENLSQVANPIVSTKLVKLCKKNRDMTAEIESMRTKMKLIFDENSKLKAQVQIYENGKLETENKPGKNKAEKTEEEILSSSQQLTQTTNKLMEYRQKYQIIQVDLKNALRALCQEVGENATPQSVLANAASPSWRGRQQQILHLQCKINELLNKIQCQGQGQCQGHLHCRGGGDGDNYSIAESCSTVDPRQIGNLQLREKKKQEQIETLTQQLESSNKEGKNSKEDLKANRARTQILESQIRNCKIQSEELTMKLKEKIFEVGSLQEEMEAMKREIINLRQNEKFNREKNTMESHETHKNLAKEKSAVAKLQILLTQKQDLIKKIEEENHQLKSSLEFYKKEEDPEKLIKTLELHLRQAEKFLESGENEREKLLKMLQDQVASSEKERLRVCCKDQFLQKAFIVIKQSEHCITKCIEMSQIVDKDVLNEVEVTRNLIREIRAGDLYSTKKIPGDDLQKLQNKYLKLEKEFCIVSKHLKRSASERKRDLVCFNELANKSRNDLLSILKENLKRKSFNVDDK